VGLSLISHGWATQPLACLFLPVTAFGSVCRDLGSNPTPPLLHGFPLHIPQIHTWAHTLCHQKADVALFNACWAEDANSGV
jgi:hypothetical protein